MKKIIFYFSLFLSLFSFSQEDKEESEKMLVNTANVNNMSQGLWLKSPSFTGTKGTPYLYDNWDSYSQIYTKSGKVLSLPSLNYDAALDRFVSKVAKDSIYVFDNRELSKVVINNQLFKLQKLNNVNSYFQLIAEAKNIEILKKNHKKIRKGVIDSYTGKLHPNRYVLIQQFFLNTPSGTQRIKLKKKSILNLFGDKKKSVKKYIKYNKLSIQNEAHLAMIFSFYDKQ